MGSVLLSVVLGLTVPAAARGDDADRVSPHGPRPVATPAFQHHEVPDDPPAPPSRLRQRRTSPAGTFTFGGFTSVQVNVDAMGNNIIGDAANEPSIAIDPTDPSKIAIGWRQFDSVESNFRQAGVAYSQDGGQSWTFPGVLDPGIFRSDPVLASDADGNFYYSSLTIEAGTSAFSVDVFKSTDGGVTWGPPVYAFGGDKQWIAVDRTDGIGRGNIYQKWSVGFSCCPPFDFTRSTDGGETFEAAIALPDPVMQWGTLEVGSNGTVYVVGLDGRNFQDYLFARSPNAQDAAQTPEFDPVSVVALGGSPPSVVPEPNRGGLWGQVWIASDHSNSSTRGNLYILSSVEPAGPDPLDVMFVRSTDGGETWSEPVRVNDDPVNNGAWQWFGTMSVAPNGRIDVAWNDTRNTGVANLSQTFFAYSTDAGVTWSTNIPIGPVWDSWVGRPEQPKIGDYYDMISDDESANLAYATTYNGEQDVYFVRIRAGDCNENGVDDLVDIAEGTSTDCNGNRIPDECEADCNTNGSADDCDIAKGTSEDCTANGIPDECEPDCNGNGLPDSCDVADGIAEDCNDNEVPDDCERAILDVDGDGIIDECCSSAALTGSSDSLGRAAGLGVVATNRFVTFAASEPGVIQSVRVTFVALPEPFHVFNGQTMWVGEPREVTEISGVVLPSEAPASPTFWAATLACEPFSIDWSEVGPVHIYHEAIVPRGVYEVQAIKEGCTAENPLNFSPPLSAQTSAYGNISGPFDTQASVWSEPEPGGGVDIVTDVLAGIAKFSNVPSAPIKIRADLEPSTIDFKVNISDIVHTLNAFSSLPYPFTPSTTTPCEP